MSSSSHSNQPLSLEELYRYKKGELPPEEMERIRQLVESDELYQEALEHVSDNYKELQQLSNSISGSIATKMSWLSIKYILGWKTLTVLAVAAGVVASAIIWLPQDAPSSQTVQTQADAKQPVTEESIEQASHVEHPASSADPVVRDTVEPIENKVLPEQTRLQPIKREPIVMAPIEKLPFETVDTVPLVVVLDIERDNSSIVFSNGGDPMLRTYLESIIRYTPGERYSENEGITKIQFVVNRKGKVKKYTIDEPLNSKLNYDLQETIESMEQWVANDKEETTYTLTLKYNYKPQRLPFLFNNYGIYNGGNKGRY